MQSIIEVARGMESELIADRRRLHANPEIGFDLHDTVAFVTGRLERLGIESREIVNSGIVACLGKPGRTLLLRAAMDALPMCEETDLPFRSRNGFDHSCGNDLQTTMLLAAAAILKQHEAELQGTVKLMFQPAAQLGTGARAMRDAGVLDAPKVDAALALQAVSFLPPGLVVLTPGIVHSSHDMFSVVVKGKGGHSSAPNLCIDPLQIVATIYMMLGSLVSTSVDPFETAVLTIGKLGGGLATNVIPDTAVLAGGLRCYKKEIREQLIVKLNEIIHNVTKLMGGTYTKEDTYVPILANDVSLCQSLSGCIRETVGTEKFHPYDRPMPGTEDFAFIAERVPSLFLTVGAGQLGGLPHHNPNVVFDEGSLASGAALYANCAFEWLRQSEP